MITEHQHQVSLFQWAELSKRKYPDLRYMFAIPNGGLRDPIVAAKLKAEGVKAGVLDIFLPVATQDYHGLFIEMKSEKGRLSKAQARYLKFLNQNGYLAIVCYGWNEAKDAIEIYLAG